MNNRITPKYINSLKENEIFIFGSNKQGRHGKGAALTAKNKFGAIYGKPRGLQGNSYAIVTKELRNNYPPVDIKEVKNEVDTFVQFVKDNQNLTFYVTEIGCNLANFTPEEIAPLFKECKELKNVYLPERFLNILQTGFII
jgi:hypothetical protein